MLFVCCSNETNSVNISIGGGGIVHLLIDLNDLETVILRGEGVTYF